jgi:hypothetical protein
MGLSFTNCCWHSPAHSFSGPSPVGFATIFYCLRFQTCLFVASYDSQGYGGLRRRYSIPPPHGNPCKLGWCPRYIIPCYRPRRKHFSNGSSTLARGLVAVEHVCYLVTGLHTIILPSEEEIFNLILGENACKITNVASLSNNKLQQRTG